MVSALLLAVVEPLLLSTAFVLLMLTVATVTSAGRVTGRDLRGTGPGRAAAAHRPPDRRRVAPVVALVLASGTVPLRGEALIPIAGILIGGAMTATSLAGRRLRDELTVRRGRWRLPWPSACPAGTPSCSSPGPPGARLRCRPWTRPARSVW